MDDIIKMCDETGRNIPNELLREIVDRLDPISFNELLLANKVCYDKLVSIRNNVYRFYLKKYKVDYEDRGNFIYIKNNVKKEGYNRNGVWNWRGLMVLYMKHFRKKKIECPNMNIKSFPIYPNMTEFVGYGNRLSDFPVQPKMISFRGKRNLLTNFPVQPKMITFSGEINRLTSFPTQPQMTDFIGDKIENFGRQPKLESIIMDDTVMDNLKFR